MADTESFFFTDAFKHFDAGLSDYVLGTAGKVIAAFTPVATSLLTLYIIMWGWAIMRSMIEEPIMDGVFRIMRLLIITGIALNIGYYNEYVVDFLWKTPEALAAVITQGHYTAGNQAQYLDTAWSQYYDYAAKYWASGSVTSGAGIGLIGIAFLIFASGVLVTGYAAFLLIMAKITLALMLSLGPLFILTAMFEATKQFFNSWVGQALNAVFIPVLAAGVISLILGVIQIGLSIGASTEFVQPSLQVVGGLVVASVVGFLILLQLPSISAALGGGLALSSLGAAGAAYSKMKGSLNAARPSNIKKSMQRARNDASAVKKAGKAAAGAPAALYRKITTRRNRVARG